MFGPPGAFSASVASGALFRRETTCPFGVSAESGLLGRFGPLGPSSWSAMCCPMAWCAVLVSQVSLVRVASLVCWVSSVRFVRQVQKGQAGRSRYKKHRRDAVGQLGRVSGRDIGDKAGDRHRGDRGGYRPVRAQLPALADSRQGRPRGLRCADVALVCFGPVMPVLSHLWLWIA